MDLMQRIFRPYLDCFVIILLTTSLFNPVMIRSLNDISELYYNQL
jgi:hypothetical protein